MIFFIVHLITGTIYTMFVQYFLILYSSFINLHPQETMKLDLYLYTCMNMHHQKEQFMKMNQATKLCGLPINLQIQWKFMKVMQSTCNDDTCTYIPTSLIILGSICECKLCIWFLDCRCVGVPLHRWSWCTDWNIWRSTLRTKLASSCRNTWN